MYSNKSTGKITGVLFLIAMVASLLGGSLLESVLSTPDYLANITANKITLMTGMVLELVNGIAVVGIAVMMFPILKRFNESLTFGYLGFRILESVFCIACAVIPLSILTLSREYLRTDSAGASYLKTIGTLLLSARADAAGLLIPIFFSLGALLFYYLLYGSELIPRFISVWGFIGALLIFILSFLDTGVIINIIFVLPIILNEIFLGIWLILKGFNPSATILGSS